MMTTKKPKIGIIRGTHIFASAASVFLTPYISKDHETKFGTFVHSVTISCFFPLSVLYYKCCDKESSIGRSTRKYPGVV